MNAAETLFLECERARSAGDLITRAHRNDKEFHFQDWVQDRLRACKIDFDDVGRNTYPDFRLVNAPQGFEVKGLAYPGRVATYDSNSQMPSGFHAGREIYYVFGRYPKNVDSENSYPVLDLVICPGSFLNADSEYEHENKAVRGFGSYGDIMIRDRKMYVVPTPFALMEGSTGLATLIVEAQTPINSPELVLVGDLHRREVDEIVSAYEFNLETNELVEHKKQNPNAGKIHSFKAYRLRGHGEDKRLSFVDREKLLAETTEEA